MRRLIAHICAIAQSIYVTDKPMQVRIFTIAFDPRQEGFPDEERCAFLLNKQVSMIRSEFFITNGKPYWTVLVQFETVVSQEKQDISKKRPLFAGITHRRPCPGRHGADHRGHIYTGEAPYIGPAEATLL